MDFKRNTILHVRWVYFQIKTKGVLNVPYNPTPRLRLDP